MELKCLTKKKSMIVVISTVVVALIIMVGVIVYNNSQKEKQIKNDIAQIAVIYDEFTKTDKHDDKLEILQSLLDKYNDYKLSDSPNDVVNKKYEEDISKMRVYFTSGYDKVLMENTFKEVEKIEDKNKLIDSIEKLEKLQEQIKSEEKVVFIEDKAKEYEDRITKLIDSYNKQLNIIEEKEKAEEVEKARIEAQQQEKNKQAITQSQNNTSDNTESTGSSPSNTVPSDNGGSSSSDNTNNGTICTTIPNTNICYVRYWIQDGKKVYITANLDHYDENGNYLGNGKDFDVWD